MKISLSMNQEADLKGTAAQDKALERDIIAARQGDWTARNNLARTFQGLLTSLAEKRASEPGKVSKHVEAGKEGLFRAAQKFNVSQGAHKFRIFAVEYIERAMDGKHTTSFMARLFGRR